MTEREERGNVVELLLREPDIVAWLGDYRPQPGEAPGEGPREEHEDDSEPPRAA